MVVAERDFAKLTGKRPGLEKFLMGEGPSFTGLDLARDDAPMRDANLCEYSQENETCRLGRHTDSAIAGFRPRAATPQPFSIREFYQRMRMECSVLPGGVSG